MTAETADETDSLIVGPKKAATDSHYPLIVSAFRAFFCRTLPAANHMTESTSFIVAAVVGVATVVSAKRQDMQAKRPKLQVGYLLSHTS